MENSTHINHGGMSRETAHTTLPLERLRADFPLIHGQMNGKPLVFLDSAASSQKPEAVIRSIDTYYRTLNANVHRGVYRLSQEATAAYEEGRKEAAAFLNAASESEIILLRGATEGINLVASSFSRAFIKPGDEILITAMEHHSNIVPWQLACEYTGAKLKVVPMNDDGVLQMDEFERLLTEKVKMVAVVQVSNTLGTINPVKEIISRAHQMNIPVLVDGCQAAPHMEIDVQSLDADFYTFSGHKIFGPTGIGVLYGKESWLDRLPPYHGGGEMIATCSFERTTYAELPHKFEAGTPNIAGGVGLAAAIRYIRSIGFDAIHNHEQALLDYASVRLSEIPGLQIFGTAPEKASLISFLVDGLHPFDIGTLLDQQGIAVRTGHHCTQPIMERFSIPGTVRASFSVYNTLEDIDRLTDGLKKAITLLS
ncbi:MAG: cysteine desulfurase [Saprospiraceae bacterium]